MGSTAYLLTPEAVVVACMLTPVACVSSGVGYPGRRVQQACAIQVCLHRAGVVV